MAHIKQEAERQVRTTGVWMLAMGSTIALGWLLHIQYYFLETDAGFIRLTYNFRGSTTTLAKS